MQKGAEKTVRITVYTLIVLLFAAIAIPSFIKPRFVTAKNSCVNNLRQIEGAKAEWAAANKKSTNAVPTEADLRPLIKLHVAKGFLVCPAGGTYTIGAVGETPKCSIGGQSHTLTTN
jgi:hypothetical protein